MKPLEGKRFLVTGASSGIGFAACKEIVNSGGTVFGVSRNEIRLAQAFEQLPNTQGEYLSFDISRLDALGELVERTGQIDGIVHCAGNLIMLPLRNMKRQHIEDTFIPHLYSPLLLTTAFINEGYLNQSGSVVFVSSTSSLTAEKSLGVYGIAKSGLSLLAKCLTAEMSEKNKYRFNCVVPALVDTAMASKASHVIGESKLDLYKAKYPLGIGRPENVAKAITFLLSDESKWITGSSIVLDGGRMCIT